MQIVNILLVFVLLQRHLHLDVTPALLLQSGKAQQHSVEPFDTQIDGVVCTCFSVE